MRRPLLLRLLPAKLSVAVCVRLYRPPNKRWYPLYQEAHLRFNPRIELRLVPGDLISDCIALTGVWEPRFTRWLRRMASHGGTMIDVGANLGYFALSWAAACPGNRCLAFEASPRNLALLQENVARNELSDAVEICPKAAGREPGTVQFDPGPPDQTGWGGIATIRGEDTIPVDVVRIDDTAGAGEIALLKVDVEGADTWALMGAERLLRQRRVRVVWYEQNKPRMRDLGIGENEAGDFLRSVGYRARPLGPPSREMVDWVAVPA